MPNPIPQTLTSESQTPLVYSDRVNNDELIYLRCIRNHSDEMGYLGYYRDPNTDDFRRFAVWVPESEKAEKAIQFKVMTHDGGMCWLVGEKYGINYIGASTDRPLHYGNDYVDFETVNGDREREYDVWFTDHGRMMFWKGGDAVCVSSSGKATNRMNVMDSGPLGFFFAEKVHGDGVVGKVEDTVTEGAAGVGKVVDTLNPFG